MSGLSVVCPEPRCGAPIGEPCTTAAGRLRRFPHAARERNARMATTYEPDLLDVDELPDGSLAQLSFTDAAQLRLAF